MKKNKLNAEQKKLKLQKAIEIQFGKVGLAEFNKIVSILKNVNSLDIEMFTKSRKFLFNIALSQNIVLSELTDLPYAIYLKSNSNSDAILRKEYISSLINLLINKDEIHEAFKKQKSMKKEDILALFSNENTGK